MPLVFSKVFLDGVLQQDAARMDFIGLCPQRPLEAIRSASTQAP